MLSPVEAAPVAVVVEPAVALVLDPGVTRGCVESKCLEPGVGATGLVGLAVLKLLPLLVLVLALAEGSELPSFVRFFLRNEPKEGIRLEVVNGCGGGIETSKKKI